MWLAGATGNLGILMLAEEYFRHVSSEQYYCIVCGYSGYSR
jgi:hypothetical protein